MSTTASFRLAHHATAVATNETGGGLKWTHADVLSADGRKVGEINHTDTPTAGGDLLSPQGITGWKRTFHAQVYPNFGLQTGHYATVEEAFAAGENEGIFTASSNR